MRNVVTGLMMLAGAVVREKGHGFDDFGWRREAQQAQEAQEADAATSGNNGSDEGDRGMAAAGGVAEVVAGPPMGTMGPSRGALMSVAATEDDAAAPGDWDVACEREAGDRLVFDRGSVREMGGATLFRWAPTGGVVPSTDDTIYTAVADCRGKSIEASWPGKRSETRAGTCGRHLVDAVCSARSAVKAPKPERERLGRARAGAPNASATP
jgi:catechol 2,3-dioxygenase-like lactoylglutathione lyase family enzyme